MQFFKDLFTNLKNIAINEWNKWLRQTVLHTIEVAFLAMISFLASVALGKETWNFFAAMTFVLIAVAKSIRANPNIPINDYVNKK